MTQPSCLSPLDWDSLLAYWLGELDAEREAQIEEHYLGCEVCSSRLEWLTTLAHDVRALVQQNSVSVIVNNEFVRRLKEHGQQVREYHVPCNGSVNCTVNKEDDYVIAYLEVPLDDVAQVDMVYLDNNDEVQIRQTDIPFSPKNRNVVFSTCVDDLHSLPSTTLRVRLLAVDSNGERTLGDYTFNHTSAN